MDKKKISHKRLKLYLWKDRLKTVIAILLGFIVLPMLLLSLWLFAKGDYQTIHYETATVVSTATRLPSQTGNDSSGLLLTIKTTRDELIVKHSLQAQYPSAGSNICLRKLQHIKYGNIRYNIAPDKYCAM